MRALHFVVEVCLIVGMPRCDILRVVHIGHAVREDRLLPRSGDTFERIKCLFFISQIENGENLLCLRAHRGLAPVL